MKLVSLLLFFSLIFGTATITAGTIYKCKDENGNMVFSQTRCGDDAETQNVEDVPVIQGGSKSATQQLEEMQAIRRSGKSASSTKKSPARESDCPPMSHIARRNKLVGDEVFKCMTQSELRGVVGRGPDSVRSGSDGEESWHWYLGSNSFHAYFDNKGRLMTWSGWSR